MGEYLTNNEIASAFRSIGNQIEYLKMPTSKKILVIAPHPDDEVLGCGGTLCRHLESGDQVNLLYLTNGEKGVNENDISERRIMEAIEVIKECQIDRYDFLNLGDQKIEISAENIETIKNIIQDNQIDIIYITHIYDNHIDHFAANILLANALTKLDCSQLEVIGYEIWSPLVPNLIVNISDHWEKKQSLVYKYKSQLEKFNFWLMSKSLSKFRALATVQINKNYIKNLIHENRAQLCKRLEPKVPWTHVETFQRHSKDDYCKFVFCEFPQMALRFNK